MNTLGERLRFFRLKSGHISQKDAALVLGLKNAPTLSNYERNLRVPDIDFLRRAAEAYGVSIDKLIGYNTDDESLNKYNINLFSKRFSERRNTLGLSFEELSRRINKVFNAGQLKMIEEGKFVIENKVMMDLLASNLACTTDYLIGLVDNYYEYHNNSIIPKELEAFLNQNVISYRGIELSEDDKMKIKISLKAIFFDKKQHELTDT